MPKDFHGMYCKLLSHGRALTTSRNLYQVGIQIIMLLMLVLISAVSGVDREARVNLLNQHQHHHHDPLHFGYKVVVCAMDNRINPTTAHNHGTSDEEKVVVASTTLNYLYSQRHDYEYRFYYPSSDFVAYTWIKLAMIQATVEEARQQKTPSIFIFLDS